MRAISERSLTARRGLSSPLATLATVIIAVLWSLPTAGLLVTSFRPQADIQRTGWWTATTFTFDNYRQVLESQTSGRSLSQAFVNSVVITVPSVLAPLAIALIAAYALAWIDFKGRDLLFVLIFALQIVPIQVTLIPLLNLFVDAGLAGTFWPVWISHTVYSLPLAIFLLHNFMRGLPKELVEAARVDGAGHVQIFLRVLAPLLVPAVAAFGIFQFLWVWNDLLVALTFANTPGTNPMTVALANLAGSRGSAWYLLSAAAFVSMLLPLVVFLSMQRFFVRGLLAGSVKG
ncbi:carbohydrate ABC transporter permease [Dactylosporangium sp. NPDC005555]|uniref:carbohydrate ABC transporter permease n=1 Tax=Dactylosporangium sp. NPDC005555 TaxID=3154889 RepID=UPI0033B03965